MIFSQDKKSVTVADSVFSTEEAVTRLAALSAKQIKSFFAQIKPLPRRIHCLALVSVLNERIKTLNSFSLSKDAFTKLQQYSQYTEYLLQTLFVKIAQEGDFLKYRRCFWRLVLENASLIGLLDGQLAYLLQEESQEMESFEIYSMAIASVSLDFEAEFDGQPVSSLPTTLKMLYSAEEIHELSEKYGITLPRRLKKETYLEIIKQMLVQKRRWTKTTEEQLSNLTVAQLDVFCMEQKLNLCASLKKEALMELFLFYLKQQQMDHLKPFSLWTDDITPLVFEVDLQKIVPFGRGEPKPIIHYEENMQPETDSVDFVSGNEPAEEITEASNETVLSEETESETDESSKVDAEEIALPEETESEADESNKVDDEETGSETDESSKVDAEEIALPEETESEADESNKVDDEEIALPEETESETDESNKVDDKVETSSVEEVMDSKEDQETKNSEEKWQQEAETVVQSEVVALESNEQKQDKIEEALTALPDSNEEGVHAQVDSFVSNPYFRNKKLLAKKKTWLFPLLTIVLIVLVLLVVFYLIKYFG